MSLVNRSAVVVRPREPFLQWAKQDDSTGIAESVFEGLRSAPNAYLIPEREDAEDPGDMVRAVWPEIFEAMLESWLTDPDMWPANRTWNMFEAWFAVEVCECVYDLVVGETLESI